jgi:carbamoyl-phosphate synthase large subunit
MSEDKEPDSSASLGLPSFERDAVNVLFVSAGRRVELVRAFKRAYATLGLAWRVIAVDADPLAPALHEADRSWIVPLSSETAFIPTLADICAIEDVALVFPLIDPDILILAQHRQRLERNGTRVVVVPEKASKVTADKLLTFQFFQELGIPTPMCWSAEEAKSASLDFPLFIKPRYGSAGEHAFEIRNRRELDFFLEYVPTPIIQECLPGPEITSDVVCDLRGTIVAVVSRRRIAVRGGEVSKGVTVYDADIANYCVVIAKALEAIGPITVQCLLRQGQPNFTEVNPRFGGGFPLALAAGADAPQWLLASAAGIPVNSPPMGTYQKGLHVARFDESFFLRKQDLDRLESHRL